MTDFEDRLRAAMHSSVAGQGAPANLISSVRRRHRRQLVRRGAAWAAAAIAAVAVIPAAESAWPGANRATPAVSAPARPSGPGTTSPQGLHYGCDAQTYGALAPDWRQGSTHAGPLWIINAGISRAFAFRNQDGTLKAVPLIVMLQDNATVTVTPTAASTPYFRFLPSVPSAGRYTLRDGKAEATFAACSDQTSMYGSGFTEYYVGVIVAGPRCVTFDVRTPPSRQAIAVRLTFGACAAGSLPAAVRVGGCLPAGGAAAASWSPSVPR